MGSFGPSATFPCPTTKSAHHQRAEWLRSYQRDTFDQLFVEEDRHISVEAAVRRLKLGHQLLQASLPEAIRNVCSSHRTSNYSTLDFLWQQREDEDKADDENTGLNAGAQQAEDSILDMTVSNSELAIVAENNPMGVWPASITRPLAKLKLGRLWGRRKEDWYKSLSMFP